MIKPKWNSESVRDYERSLKPKVEDDDDIQDYKKPWVGLTEKERLDLAVDLGAMSADWLPFMEAVEAKLKEKNT